MVEDGSLSMGHARALIGAEDAVGLAARGGVARAVGARGRKAAAPPQAGGASRNRAAPGPSANRRTTPISRRCRRHLEEFLGLPVRINTDADPRSGSVTIRYPRSISLT
jgi:ParB family chromosome partitioning protein